MVLAVSSGDNHLCRDAVSGDIHSAVRCVRRTDDSASDGDQCLLTRPAAARSLSVLYRLDAAAELQLT